MQDYQREFIEFAIEQDVLRFGEFTLKSGRVSPYFFNAGLFRSGQALARLGRFYARAIVESGLEADVLFGPAYKGIPLATLAAASLAEHAAIVAAIPRQLVETGGVCVPHQLGHATTGQVIDRDRGHALIGTVTMGQPLGIDVERTCQPLRRGQGIEDQIVCRHPPLRHPGRTGLGCLHGPR